MDTAFDMTLSVVFYIFLMSNRYLENSLGYMRNYHVYECTCYLLSITDNNSQHWCLLNSSVEDWTGVTGCVNFQHCETNFH